MLELDLFVDPRLVASRNKTANQSSGKRNRSQSEAHLLHANQRKQYGIEKSPPPPAAAAAVSPPPGASNSSSNLERMIGGQNDKNKNKRGNDTPTVDSKGVNKNELKNKFPDITVTGTGSNLIRKQPNLAHLKRSSNDDRCN